MTDAERLARAVLLFHSGEPWDDAARVLWAYLAATPEATTRTLADLARRVLLRSQRAGPGYWMHETSGVLRPAVEKYLTEVELAPSEIAALRSYLRQWIESDLWFGEDVTKLRGMIDGLVDRASIAAWIDLAVEAGCDPL